MPLSDPDRIEAERLTPHILSLWRALRPLQSVVSYMNTGAHPDDEHSALLAALAWRDGIDISYACSTRGEGGQNNLGTETGAALGILRTEEMERACDVIGLRMYWLSEAADDPITDFGFSKSGHDTLRRWGRDHTIRRMVDILRLERPDIICPTFLDVPGQHGHHRAMTEAAIEAFDLAADPAYRASPHAPWEVKKMYLPAWSGAGQAYDDETPPPPETCRVIGTGRDPVTGWSYARIGQQSRGCHASQGMGQWVPHGQEHDYPLHLLKSRVSDGKASLTAGLPQRLTDLPLTAARDHLTTAQSHMEAAISAFPNTAEILKHACAALSALRHTIPANAGSEHLHKLQRKDTQLCHLIRIAAQVDIHGTVAQDTLSPDTPTAYTIETNPGSADNVHVTPDLPSDWQATDTQLTVSVNAAPSDGYRSIYLPDAPPKPNLQVAVTAHGITATSHIAFETQPLNIPQNAIPQIQSTFVMNQTAGQTRFTVDLSTALRQLPTLMLDLPKGWTQSNQNGQITVTLPPDAPSERATIALHADGQAVQTVTPIRSGKGAPRILVAPAQLSVQVLSVALPYAKIGYIGADKDTVDVCLSQIGADITALTDEDIKHPDRLAQFDSLIIGVFAVKMRAGLADALPRIHNWVKAGGTLLTLYHRPWDNWDPATVPPRPLTIGQPSLRWRVTDENAPVTCLAPDHPVLATPNPITDQDWQGWHKERGLYFAQDWDSAYTPILSMQDKGDTPLKGALLVADIGKGRHIHSALNLHHQMAQQVPGAYRLMANLLAGADTP